MSDVDIDVNQNDENIFDIAFGDDGDFVKTQGFDTSLKIAIFEERRASSSEVPNVLQRRGWIGNVNADDQGFEIGSKIWIYLQSRLTNSTISSIKKAAQESLQYLIDDGLAKNVNVEILSVTSVKISVKATIEFSNSIVEDIYYDLWINTGVE